MYYFLVVCANFAIYFLCFSPKDPKQKASSPRLKRFFIISFLLILAQTVLFTTFKPKNLYEIHNKSRQSFEILNLKVTDESQLLYIPSKARPNSVAEYGEYILNHGGLRTYYDKYGPNFVESLEKFSQWGNVKHLTMEKSIVESMGFYCIVVLIGVCFSRKYKSNALKKWCATLILACFFLEMELFFEKLPQEGFLGSIKPNLAYFERIVLYKLIVISLCSAFIAYYAFFKVNKLQRFEKKALEMTQLNASLEKLSKVQEEKITKSVTKIKSNVEVFNNYVQEYAKYKTGINTSTKLPSVLLMIFCAAAFAYQFPVVQNAIYSSFEFKNFTAEDYIKL